MEVYEIKILSVPENVGRYVPDASEASEAPDASEASDVSDASDEFKITFVSSGGEESLLVPVLT